jgi:putative acetyltransferase
MERYGPGGEGPARSQVKLCLVATDIAFLANLLHTLSLRPDCHYVKYGTRARDGMYLGRCFLQSAEAAGELCQALKGHPRLMVSLQDDDFFARFRDAPLESGACAIWDDEPDEHAQVARVHEQAFGRPAEAALVAAVRAAGADLVSLAAGVRDPGTPGAWTVLGHVLLSPVTVDGHATPAGLGLAPVAVVADHQGEGIGTQLIHAALRRARLLGHGFVVVLGHPQYYPRFGFRPASQLGLRYPDPVPDEVFMALELTPGALAGVAGVVRYHVAFADL